MNFNKWVDTFLSEKEVDLDETFEFTDFNDVFHIMDYGVVAEGMKQASAMDKNNLKRKMVELDFRNADIPHFLRAMGHAVAAM